MTPAALTPERAHRLIVIVWAAMLVSLGPYLLITQVVPVNQAGPNSPLPVPLLAVAIAAVLGSVYFKSSLGSREGQARSLDKVRAGHIIAFVLCQLAGLLGLITFILSAWQRAWIFFAVSAAGFLINFPQREDFERAAR